MLKNKILKDHGTWLEIDASTNKYPNSVVKIDRCFYLALPDRKVSININGYPRISIKYKSIELHKLVVDHDITDHKNRDRLDCRVSNLRECTTQENCMNRGALGVTFDNGKWRAYIHVNGKTNHLGRYTKKQDAIDVRLKAETEHFGEFARNGTVCG